MLFFCSISESAMINKNKIYYMYNFLFIFNKWKHFDCKILRIAIKTERIINLARQRIFLNNR